MNDNVELEGDIGCEDSIDRTIPNGVISVDEQGRKTVFKDGQFVLVDEE